MPHIEQHDKFGQALAALPACSLDRRDARAQNERYRAIAPFVTNVRRESRTVVLDFADDLDGAAIDEVISVERQCCSGVLDFEFDRPARSLTVTAPGPAGTTALDLVAAGFRERPTRRPR